MEARPQTAPWKLRLASRAATCARSGALPACARGLAAGALRPPSAGGEGGAALLMRR